MAKGFSAPGLVAIALAAGVAAGAAIDRARSPAEKGELPRSEAPPTRRAGRSASGGRESDAATAAVARPPVPAPAGEAEKAAAARAVDLASRIDALVASGDGPAITKLFRELVCLGRPGYAAAAHIADLVLEDVHADRPRLGLTYWDFMRMAMGHHARGFLLWLATDATEVPATMRSEAAELILMVGDIDPTDDLVRALAAEPDPRVAASLAGCLGTPSAAYLPDLLTAARTHRANDAARTEIFLKIGAVGTPGAFAALREFADSPDPAVAADARFVLRRWQPPEKGAMVTFIGSDYPASGPLRKGDILVSRNGAPVLNAVSTQMAIHTLKPGERTSLLVHRDAGFVTVEIEGPLEGFMTDWVDPGR